MSNKLKEAAQDFTAALIQGIFWVIVFSAAGFMLVEFLGIKHN